MIDLCTGITNYMAAIYNQGYGLVVVGVAAVVFPAAIVFGMMSEPSRRRGFHFLVGGAEVLPLSMPTDAPIAAPGPWKNNNDDDDDDMLPTDLPTEAPTVYHRLENEDVYQFVRRQRPRIEEPPRVLLEHAALEEMPLLQDDERRILEDEQV